MASRAFTIIPLDDNTDGTVGNHFVWTAANGAMPRGDMPLPQTTMRTKRTDYTGNEGSPTEQILGWQLEDGWQVSGDWDWRRMGRGVPEITMAHLEALIKSGSRVAVQLDDFRYVGRVTRLEPTVFTYGIRYQLTISPHSSETSGPAKRPGGLRGQTRIRTPDEYRTDVGGALQAALDRQAGAPAWAFSGSYHADMAVTLGDMSATMAQIDAVLANRADGRTTPLATMRASVSLFAQVQVDAVAVAAVLGDVSSDAILAWDNPAGILAYESWSRGIASDMREAEWRAYQAIVALGLRVDPSVMALYRPARGESLYGIARKFYGQPLLWREIATRNQLAYTNLQGTECLVIPMLGASA